ncbi:MAG TPA: hypothetical protein VFS08_12415 [Gemmatimonadaceae bacterium]|nr:hypothetical protein [Gemmatimonadaceae bacterium]
MRAPLLVRVRSLTAVLTALLTVWCLGCSSFEVLLDHWGDTHPPVATVVAGSDAAAPDATERGAAESGGTHADDAGAVLTAGGPTSPSVGAAATQSPDAHACGCVAGHAVTPLLVASSPPPASTPRASDEPVTMPTSIARAPLVPPPVA